MKHKHKTLSNITDKLFCLFPPNIRFRYFKRFATQIFIDKNFIQNLGLQFFGSDQKFSVPFRTGTVGPRIEFGSNFWSARPTLVDSLPTNADARQSIQVEKKEAAIWVCISSSDIDVDVDIDIHIHID